MVKAKLITFVLLWLVVALIACTGQDSFSATTQPTDSPTVTLEPTATQTPETVSETPMQPTATSLPPVTTAPTIEPTPTVESIPTAPFDLTDCLQIDQNNQPAITWHTLPDNSRWLDGIDCPIQSIDASPDGRWLVLNLEKGVEFQIPYFSTVLVDTQDENHALLNANLVGRKHSFAWLSDSQLIWVDEGGSVWAGNGLDASLLEAPRAMTEVWYSSPVGGLATDVNGAWWRFTLPGDQWENVTGLPRTNGRLGMALDGRYGLLFSAGGLWMVPTAFGEAAAQLLPPDSLPLVGTDGSLVPRINQLAEKSLWFVSSSIWSSRETSAYPREGFVFDVVDNRLLTQEDFSLSETFKIVGFDMSPDGQWLAVLVNEAATSDAIPTSVYLTNVNDLSSGYIIDNVLPTGWHEGKTAILTNEYAFLSENEGELQIIQLDSGDAVQLTNVAEWIGATQQYFLATLTSEPDTLFVFDYRANLIQQFEMPDACTIQNSIAASSGKFYLALTNDNCPHLVKYQLSP